MATAADESIGSSSCGYGRASSVARSQSTTETMALRFRLGVEYYGRII